MKWLFLLLLLTPALVLAQPAPTLTAHWEGTPLRVTWSGDGCIYLGGGGRLTAFIDCGDGGDLLLPTGGVSDDYAPQLRTWVELRPYHGASLFVPVPPRAVLPLVIKPEPGPVRWRVILPMITKPPG